MDDTEFDVGGASAPPDKLDALNEVIEEAVALEEAVAQMEEDLKVAKKALHILKFSRIPDMMDEVGMDEATFRGWKVKVGDFVSGSLPKAPEALEAALRWLEDNGGGPLIKTNIGLAFAKSQHNEAMDLAHRLTSEGFDLTVGSGVHAQSLQAFARERIRNGEPIDVDTLGLYVGKVAKLKRVGD